MHILRLTPHFYWPQLEDRGWPVAFDTIGGMQTQIARQSHELSDRGVRQTLMTLRIPGVDSEWEAGERFRVLAVRVPILPLRSRTRGMIDLNASWALGVLKEVVRREPAVDVVHAHCSGVVWPLLVGRWAARRLDVPLVLTIHCSLLGTYHPMNFLDRLTLPWARRTERKVVGEAAHTIALTPGSYDKMLQAGYVAPEAMSIVPDSIDVADFRSKGSPERAREFAKKFRIPADRPVVTYIGRIAREKGWRRLPELASLLEEQGAHFLVCGDGNECDLLRREIRRQGLESRFTITGYLAMDWIPAALANTEVLVLPSVHEEFGGVLIEAMAMAVPSVAFAVGGVPHVQQDGETGILVPAGDVEGMAREVARLLADPGERARMGRVGEDFVQRTFDLSATGAALEEIYRRVIGP